MTFRQFKAMVRQHFSDGAYRIRCEQNPIQYLAEVRHAQGGEPLVCLGNPYSWGVRLYMYGRCQGVWY